jgi:citrate synthase
MADKPSKGLADVVAASTALSDIDGQAGRLFYRGYDIHQLAGASTFEEIAYLLQRGSAPGPGELGGYRAELVAGRTLGKLVSSTLPQIAASQGPMEAMRSLVSLASADDPDESSNAAAANERKAARLTRSSRSWSPPTTRPARGVSACRTIPASAWPLTSCSSCVAPPRPRGMLRSWTPAWCCTRTTR